jgi:WD40 repeat protein
MSQDENPTHKVQADDNSIVVGGIQIGGDVRGSIHIGNVGLSVKEVSVLLTQITENYQRKPFDGRCPYKGLDVFEEEDADLFFGRERLVEDLVSCVKESRTLFITGPSGSGKSSLVRAGLIHALKLGAIKNLHSEGWLYETMKPGLEPLKQLALAFSRLKSPELENYFLLHANESTVLHQCAESVLTGRQNQRFVLFVDQFEEIFTQVGQVERLLFINMLVRAATMENGRTIVLFAMRSDFVPTCATYPSLNELLGQGFRQIGAMRPEELVSAIARPAKQVGLSIEDELIARMVNDMKGEPGALPLMQFALKDLFDSQQEIGGVIALTLQDYEIQGGINKSLERHADNSFEKLNESERQLARFIFSGLIEVGRGTSDTSRTAVLEELIPANTKAQEILTIIHKLADARLIITDEHAGKDTVTIAHETLIDAWPWLKNLVNENRDVITLQNEITYNAKEWDKHNRDESYLYTGARLANAREQLDAKKLVLSGIALKFLQASIKSSKQETDALKLEQERKTLRQKQVITRLMVFIAIILVLLIFALDQLNMSRALQLGTRAQAALAEQNYQAAALYAYQSNQIRPNEVATQVLGKVPYEKFSLGKGFLGHLGPVSSIAWSSEGNLASGSEDGSVIIWNLSTGEPAQTLAAQKDLEGNPIPVLSVAWFPNGDLASSFENGKVTTWHIRPGQPAQTFVAYGDLKDQSVPAPISSVAWSPNGDLAAGLENGDVMIWHIATGHATQLLVGYRDLQDKTVLVSSVAWSPNGDLASGLDNGNLIIWDLSTGEPAWTGSRHTGRVASVAWSPDGDQLASGAEDGTVIVWDLSTKQPLRTLKGRTSPVLSVAWSTDGHHLASGAEDGTVIVWDLNTGESTWKLKGHTGSVLSVAWSPDGDLASGSRDKSIKIARGPLILREPCDWIGRNMTADEWVDSQGLFYIYRPACPKFPVPVTAPQNMRYPSLTWIGRGILLGVAMIIFLPPIALFSFILSGSYFEIPRRFFRWVWRQLYG